ncbi:hypothetical protein QR680_019046 [Steinernema hermaphroditum]|uniref:Uncharacterized protein n=1 Tax=Steinernema hermaphroditum TaxID=289476 RepID=A0AA39LS13_9BILA|nr:hypothetical protein QR680_019046 [Steinernema hermaphroditum]
MKFVGKVAIVTGSSNGIGQAAAVLLASEGASVTIHGRSEEGLQTTEKLILDRGIPSERILSVQGDIEDEKTTKNLVEKTLERFGKIDVLVNNAGLASKQGMIPDSMDNYEYLHVVNIKSVIKLIQLAEPYLEKTKGSIVNVSSICSTKASPRLVYYSMSKAALDHYMRSRTHELAKKGIRINNLNPGLTRTNAFAASGMTPDQVEQFIGALEAKIPLGRAGSSEEMAKAIAFLASDDASYVTGVALVTDGGLLQQADV